MIDITPEARLKSTVRPGTVYLYQEESFSSDASHFFIVLNDYRATDQVLLLVYPSSQVEKVRRRRRDFPPETLVEIKQDEYLNFTVDSIVDCNTVIRKNIEELIQKLSQGKLKIKANMPVEILGKLTNAVHLSPMVSEEDKEMLAKVQNRVNSGYQNRSG